MFFVCRGRRTDDVAADAGLLKKFTDVQINNESFDWKYFFTFVKKQETLNDNCPFWW